jgi:hypothetical protein
MRLPLGPGHASPTLAPRFSTSIARPKNASLSKGTGAAALAFSPLDERRLQPPGAARGSWGFDPDVRRCHVTPSEGINMRRKRNLRIGVVLPLRVEGDVGRGCEFAENVKIRII